MYCNNCGEKLAENVKFCSNCGTKTNSLLNNFPNESTVSNESSINNTSQSIIEECFEQTFKKNFPLPAMFGDSVRIFGKDEIDDSDVEIIKKYYMCDYDKDEKPLLVFDFSADLEEGFLITNQRLIWHYSTGSDEVKLTDIVDVSIKHLVLARVMAIRTSDNVKRSSLWLTGIWHLKNFVDRFSQFIEEANNSVREELK